MSGEKQEIDHSGHRQRMKKHFIESGLEGFSDINALEMVLFYAIPRKDTNEIAHKLLDRFGSYTAVLEANVEELLQVEGITEHAAILLTLIPRVNKRYMEQKSTESKKLSTCEAMGEFFVPKFAYEANECAYVLFLDGKMRIITCRKLSEGVVFGTDISIRGICELALRYKASYAVVSHNHPTGNTMPSKEDVQSTGALKKALQVIGVELRDHIIVAGEHWLSLAKCGMMERSLM